MTLITDIIKQIIRVLGLDNLSNEIRTEVRRNYESGMDKMEVELNMNFDRNPEIIEYLEEYQFDNIKGMTDDVAEKLRKELNEGIQNLESIGALKKRIQNTMNIGEHRALMIARTEANRAENYGKLDAAKQSGLDLRKYLSVHIDDRTSPICRAMMRKYGTADQAISVDKLFKVTVKGKVIQGEAPPFHPNCRTAVVFTQEE